MNDKINSLSPKRKTGQLYKMKEDIERLKAKLMGKNELEQALQQTISLITEQKKEYNRLDKEQTSVSDILDKASRRKDLLAFKEQYVYIIRSLQNAIQLISSMRKNIANFRLLKS